MFRIFLFFLGFFVQFSVFALEMGQVSDAVFEPKIDISGGYTTKIPQNTLVEFSSHLSRIIPDTPAEFLWKVEGESRERRGEKIQVAFSTPGTHRITLTIIQGQAQSSLEKVFEVYNRHVLFIHDKEIPTVFEDFSVQKGVYLHDISFPSPTSLEEALSPFSSLEFSHIIVDISSRDLLFSLVSLLKDLRFSLASLVFITHDHLDLVWQLYQRIILSSFQDSVVLSRYEGVYAILESEKTQNLDVFLKERGVDFVVLTPQATSSFLPLSYSVEKLLFSGVSEKVLFAFLIFPVIVFFFVFIRQVVGISTHSVFISSFFTLSFLLFGIFFTSFLFLLLLLSGVLILRFFSLVPMLYVPRNGFFFATLGLCMFILFGYFPLIFSFQPTESLLLMSVLLLFAERFHRSASEYGYQIACKDLLVTWGVAIIIAYAVRMSFIEKIILSYPELVLLFYFGIIWLGRYTGLRFLEYWKFYDMKYTHKTVSKGEKEE